MGQSLTFEGVGPSLEWLDLSRGSNSQFAGVWALQSRNEVNLGVAGLLTICYCIIVHTPYIWMWPESAEYHCYASHTTELRATTAKHGDLQNCPKRIPAKATRSKQSRWRIGSQPAVLNYQYWVTATHICPHQDYCPVFVSVNYHEPKSKACTKNSYLTTILKPYRCYKSSYKNSTSSVKLRKAKEDMPNTCFSKPTLSKIIFILKTPLMIHNLKNYHLCSMVLILGRS